MCSTKILNSVISNPVCHFAAEIQLLGHRTTWLWLSLQHTPHLFLPVNPPLAFALQWLSCPSSHCLLSLTWFVSVSCLSQLPWNPVFPTAWLSFGFTASLPLQWRPHGEWRPSILFSVPRIVLNTGEASQQIKSEISLESCLEQCSVEVTDSVMLLHLWIKPTQSCHGNLPGCESTNFLFSTLSCQHLLLSPSPITHHFGLPSLLLGWLHFFYFWPRKYFA